MQNVGKMFGPNWLSSLEAARINFKSSVCRPANSSNCRPVKPTLTTSDGTIYALDFKSGSSPMLTSPAPADEIRLKYTPNGKAYDGVATQIGVTR